MPNDMPTGLPNLSATRIALFVALLVIAGCVGLTFFIGTPHYANPQVAAAAAALPDPFADIQITAQSAYVLDATNNRVLYAKNADAPMALASVTKLMLAVVASEMLSPDDTIIITPTAIAQDGDSGLVAGEAWRMQDLLDFTLIISSNDGAEALAEAAAEKIRRTYPDAPHDTPVSATIWMMNKKAHDLGMAQTYYLDTNGLDVSTTMAGAYGSAHDMGALMQYATTERLDALVGTTEADKTFVSLGGVSHTAYTTNESLGGFPGLIAGKTGFTDLAGGNLVVAFDAIIGHPIIIAVLGSTKDARFNDVQTLARIARNEITQ